MKKAISISVNGVSHQHEVEPRLLLVHYLRDVLGLTGTHIGCETSLCQRKQRPWLVSRRRSTAFFARP